MDNLPPGVNIIDPVEARTFLVDICDHCNEIAYECECEIFKGYHRDWCYECRACLGVFVTEEKWSNHECNPSDDEEGRY